MEIKPFSEDITTGRAEETTGNEGERNYNEVSQEPLDQPKIKAFSDDITTSDNISVNRELTPEEKKLLKNTPENKKLPGFAGHYEKEQRDALLKMGFSKVEISDVEKLYRKGPETGFTRYTDPKAAPKSSDVAVVIKAWGFADLGKDGYIHPDISYSETNLSKIIKAFSDDITTRADVKEFFDDGEFPSFKFPKNFTSYPEDYKKRLTEQGFSKKEIIAVEKLGKGKPQKGYTRYTDQKNWVAGGDASNMIMTWGFVDIDKVGMIDRTFPLY